jgi:hypothetical protein
LRIENELWLKSKATGTENKTPNFNIIVTIDPAFTSTSGISIHRKETIRVLTSRKISEIQQEMILNTS